MKSRNLALTLLLTAVLAGCAQVAPIPRDELAANLTPILKLERRSDQVKYYTQMLNTLGGLSEEKAADLKAHYDVYYVYYLAANVHLARGNMESYLAHVKLAGKELDFMEALVKERLTKLAESESAARKRSPQSGL